MGDASRGRRLLVAAVMAAVLAGVGAAAQAGLLSRAESSPGSSRAAGAAIGTEESGDVVAVAESRTSADFEGNGEASATLLRVGDTNIGEAPNGTSQPLVDLLGAGPAPEVLGIGCNSVATVCVDALRSYEEAGDGEAYAYIVTAEAGVAGNYVALLASESASYGCGGFALGTVAYIQPSEASAEFVDLSEAESDECNIR